MSKQSDQVITGYVRLSVSERNAVVQEINKINQAAETERKALEESIAKRGGLPLGPLDSGKCACCGR